MDQIVAIAALFKLVGSILMFILFIYALAVEENAKRKITELVSFVIFVVVIMAMQFLVPKLAGPNSQKLRDACTAWDPSPLWAN